MEFIANRKSIRQFKNESIPEKDIRYILETAMRAPSYMNSQIISLIAIRDKEKLNKIATLCGNQTHIKECDTFVVAVIDFYKLNHLIGDINVENSIEGIIIGTHDAGILLSQLQLTANAMGYGNTMIGAIRSNPKAFIDLLELPKHTFPILATTIGIPTDEAKNIPLKPKMDMNGLIFYDKYDTELASKSIETYNDKIKEHYISNNYSYIREYNDVVSAFFKRELPNTTKEALNMQGFSF